MIDASAYSATPHSAASRASLIHEAHQFLMALIGGHAHHSQVTESALLWLTERHLIDEVFGEEGALLLEVTPRGRDAVLGKQAQQPVLN